MCRPESVILSSGEKHPRPAGTPTHRVHLSTAPASDSSLVGTSYHPAQGLCVIWEKVTHRPDGHSPTLIPQPTPAQLYTATLTPGKSPRFIGKGKADAVHSPPGPFSGSSPRIPSHSGSTISQLDEPWATHSLSRNLDPGPWTLEGAGPAPQARILSQIPSWSQ